MKLSHVIILNQSLENFLATLVYTSTNLITDLSSNPSYSLLTKDFLKSISEGCLSEDILHDNILLDVDRWGILLQICNHHI